MKPAFSVIFFTVFSGAGLGMFALLALLDLAGFIGTAQTTAAAHGALFALAFVVIGLCASTLHLANPRNAWRSFARFGTSWLSREAVFALAFLVVASGYALMLFATIATALRPVVAIVVVVLAWTVLICTAMIYASLKPIRQWHTSWTPVSYVALGHWSGAVLLLAWIDVEPLAPLAAGAGVVAALAKAFYWRVIDSAADSTTLERAIGVDRGVRPPALAGGPSIMRARLLDVGHSHGTFLTEEFGFVLARRYRSLLRATFWIAGIALPLTWIVIGLPGWRGAVLAGALCLIGVIAERWLFFAEARHTVRLYHGDTAT